jgi:spectinomycin phosphotransferase/16S rRNA (guanine(1405)-N(7))-methyltransferase
MKEPSPSHREARPQRTQRNSGAATQFRLRAISSAGSLAGVLSPPAAVTSDALASVLDRGWGLKVASVAYRPVGCGSHHWETGDADGGRWWATVDDLVTKPVAPPTTAFDRLRASLSAARSLREHGRDFVVAPLTASDGQCLLRVDERYAVALYPYVDGQRFSWGEFSTPEHRRATLDMILGVHTAPAAVRDGVARDDFTVGHRAELESILDSDAPPAAGPYGRAMVDLLRAHADPIRRILAHYDGLVASARERPGRAVLTHGEPHPGNTMRTADTWVLIDWDTAMVAPPERDLWLIEPGDGSVLAAYAEATGVAPLPEMLELYRTRWELADIAVEVGRFRRDHDGSADDDAAWRILSSTVESLAQM